MKVKVKTLKPHRNSHGDKFAKQKGDIYDHPDPRGEIAAGIVELVAAPAPAAPKPAEAPSAAAASAEPTKK